jgi:hypothetical protein
MVSSDRFGGRGTTAGSRVQVGSTAETKAGTLLPAEQQARRGRQGQLLSHDITNVDVRRPLQQGVEVWIVCRLWIGAEDGRIDIDVQLGAYIRQAPPALTMHGSVDVPTPEILIRAGGLQLTRYRNRPNQIQIQSFKGGIVGPKLSHRPHRASLEIPDVDSQHSRLK